MKVVLESIESVLKGYLRDLLCPQKVLKHSFIVRHHASGFDNWVNAS